MIPLFSITYYKALVLALIELKVYKFTVYSKEGKESKEALALALALAIFKSKESKES